MASVTTFYASCSLVSGPAVEPVEIGDLKRHARVETDLEDAELVRYGIAAREKAEELTERQLISARYRFNIHYQWPGICIPIPKPPLIAVDSITYVDQDEATQTLATGTYLVDDLSTPGVVELKQGQAWPSVFWRRNAITIEFRAGYGTNPADVPERVKTAILQMATTWYDNRETVISGTMVNEVPQTAQWLLEPLCVGGQA